jgi:hypothetical protein
MNRAQNRCLCICAAAASVPLPNLVLKGLHYFQKRPIIVSKEAYTLVKRGLWWHQKRPIHMAKELSGGILWGGVCNVCILCV